MYKQSNNAEAEPKIMQWFLRKKTSSEINIIMGRGMEWECKEKGMQQTIEYWDV